MQRITRLSTLPRLAPFPLKTLLGLTGERPITMILRVGRDHHISSHALKQSYCYIVSCYLPSVPA